MVALDLIGVKIGKLTAVSKAESEKGHSRFVCLCECGNTRTVDGYDFKRGRCKSCGCHKRTTMAFRDHPLYDIWKGIKARCRDKGNVGYKNYGGRGVRVCDEWRKDFFTFYRWAMENGWQQGLQVDKDSIGDGLLYSPETCKILTRLDNARGSRQTKLTVEKAEAIRNSNKRTSELAEEFNISKSTIRSIKSGKTWK